VGKIEGSSLTSFFQNDKADQWSRLEDQRDLLDSVGALGRPGVTSAPMFVLVGGKDEVTHVEEEKGLVKPCRKVGGL
jgi:hypothetical protein